MEQNRNTIASAEASGEAAMFARVGRARMMQPFCTTGAVSSPLDNADSLQEATRRQKRSADALLEALARYDSDDEQTQAELASVRHTAKRARTVPCVDDEVEPIDSESAASSSSEIEIVAKGTGSLAKALTGQGDALRHRSSTTVVESDAQRPAKRAGRKQLTTMMEIRYDDDSEDDDVNTGRRESPTDANGRSQVSIASFLAHTKRLDAEAMEVEQATSKTTVSSAASQQQQPESTASANNGVRRQGTSAAVRASRTARSAKWTPVADMAKALGIKHISAVDPGRTNLAIFRIRCSDLKITHWKLIALDDLCAEAQAANRALTFDASDAPAFSHDDRFHAFFQWCVAECSDDGCFDSELVLVERQEFSREMASIQTLLQCAVISAKKPIAVREDVEGELPRKHNLFSSCPQVGADSVKTCYEPLFPRLAAATIKQKQKRAFGMGNANRDGDVKTPQYAENKRNSKKYGQLIIPTGDIIKLLGASMSDDQKARFKKAKKDDIYDAMWIALYGLETVLPCLYSRRKRGFGAAITMYGAVPQRTRRTYDALHEFMDAVKTAPANRAQIEQLLGAAKGAEKNSTGVQ